MSVYALVGYISKESSTQGHELFKIENYVIK